MSVAKLREIARQKWDLIYSGPSAAHPEGEYDTFLLQAADKLREGESIDAVADFLVEVETERFGIDSGSGIRERAVDLATGIRAYVSGLAESALEG